MTRRAKVRSVVFIIIYAARRIVVAARVLFATKRAKSDGEMSAPLYSPIHQHVLNQINVVFSTRSE